jgi:hypothetical protein
MLTTDYPLLRGKQTLLTNCKTIFQNSTHVLYPRRHKQQIEEQTPPLN